MLNKISKYINTFLPSEETSKEIMNEFKSGTFFFCGAVACAGVSLAEMFLEKGKEAEDRALVGLVAAVACIALGSFFYLHSKRPQKPTLDVEAPKEEKTISVLEKPRGITNGGNTCFISALFQTFVNDPKLAQDIKTIGDYSIEKNENVEPWKFVLDTLNNFKGLSGSLNPMRPFALDERTQQNGVMGDPHELLQGMLRSISSENNEKIPKNIRPFYFEEKRIVEWKKSINQTGLEADNQKFPEQIAEDFSPQSSSTEEKTPAWCFSIEVQQEKTLSQLLGSYFQKAEPQEKTIKKVYDSSKKLLRVESVSERVELGDAKPSRFFVHMKRFVANKGEKPRKIATSLKVEEVFSKQLEANTNAPYRISLEQAGWKKSYTLQSIILHTCWGETIDKGHYTALVRNNGVWWVCDDSTTYWATQKDIQKYLTEGYLYQFNLEEPVQEAGQIVIGDVNK